MHRVTHRQQKIRGLFRRFRCVPKFTMLLAVGLLTKFVICWWNLVIHEFSASHKILFLMSNRCGDGVEFVKHPSCTVRTHLVHEANVLALLPSNFGSI